MNSTRGEPASADSDPSTIEISIGLLALVLALAAVVVAIAQLHLARTTKRRQSNLESGHIEMVPRRTPGHHSHTDSVRSDHRQVTITNDLVRKRIKPDCDTRNSVDVTIDTTANTTATDAANVLSDVPDP